MAEARPQTTISLTGRIAAAVGAVLILGGLVVLLAALAYGRHAAREAYDRLLVGAASDIAESITIRDGAPIVDMPVSAFELLALSRGDRIDYRVVDSAGRTLTGSRNAPRPSGFAPLALYDGTFGPERARYAAITRRFAERGYAGPVQVIVGHTLRERRLLARDIAQNALVVLGAAGIVIALFASLAVLSALRPLGRLGAALHGRDPTDLTPLAHPAPSEIAYLRDALNGFMSRLSRQLAANRDLISDAAHQLRTPLAAIRAQLDAAAEEPDPARRDALLQRVQSGARRLSRLLDQLLSQGMVIHRADAIPKQALDLRDIALEIFEEGDIDVTAARGQVRLDLPGRQVTVTGDHLSLTEAGKNLLGNALAHGTPPITLTASHTGGEARLTVTDAGQGPGAEILSGMATRFRPGRAAASGGLGLAIAHAVAGIHGGRIDAASGPAGFSISIVLPPGTAAWDPAA